MGFSLSPGVTCCRTVGFTFLLDVTRDRYFALGDTAARSFERLADGCHLDDADRELAARLTRGRLLVETSGDDRPAYCAYASAATDSAIDRADALGIQPSILPALRSLCQAKWSLRHRGLASTLYRLSARKRTVLGSDNHAAVFAIAAAFERCNWVASPRDQCLPRSIAVAHRMLDRGLSPTLVIGVQAQPFSAHAWVDGDGLIVNDRFDTIHPYQPILAL